MSAVDRSERCQLGQHETVAAPGAPQCTGRVDMARDCWCWCHDRARTDRRLVEHVEGAVPSATTAAVLELASHLRFTEAALDEDTVERVAVLVLDLGWRRVLGSHVHPDDRVPDPLLVPASTVRALDSHDDHVAEGAMADLIALVARHDRDARARPTDDDTRSTR